MIPWGPKIETGYLGIPQLYDMKQAGEKVNLATEHPEKVFELQQILRKVRDKSIQMKYMLNTHQPNISQRVNQDKRIT